MQDRPVSVVQYLRQRRLTLKRLAQGDNVKPNPYTLRQLSAKNPQVPSPSHMCKIECGVQPITPRQVAAISTALKLDPYKTLTMALQEHPGDFAYELKTSFEIFKLRDLEGVAYGSR